MNPEQIRMVQQSFEQFFPQATEISARFYEHLFRIDPSMRPLFRADIPSQSRKFMAMLRITVKGIDRIDQIAPCWWMWESDITFTASRIASTRPCETR